MNIFLSNTKEDQIYFDILRSIVLASYIKHWGFPFSRTISTKKDQAFGVEVYQFINRETGLYRIATIGVAAQTPITCHSYNKEFLLCLPLDLVDEDNTSLLVNYVLDIMAYSLRSDVDLRVGSTIPESPLAPNTWTTTAMLIDEARGEPEEMESFDIGIYSIDLLWLIPITGSEYKLIKSKGLQEFFQLEDKSDFSLIDVHRSGIV